MIQNRSFFLFIVIALLLQACGASVVSPIGTVSPLPAITTTPLPSITPTTINTPMPTFVPMSDFMSGMTFDTGFGYKNGFESLEADNQLLNVIKPMGVTWIALMAPCSLDSINSPKVTCNEEAGTPNDRSLKHVIQYAKSLGLRVLLKPNLVIPSGGYALEIKMQSEADWQSFFASYTEVMVHFAKIADESGVDYFSIGTEMNATQPREDDWRQLIKEVRDVYHGPLTYSSNHSGGETSVQWWNALDAIGVDAYYPLTNIKNPTVDQLKAAWSPHVSTLETLSVKWNKPIIFTEAGYTSEDGTNQEPWAGRVDQPLDLQEQADCYQALIEVFRDKPWWKGVFWYHQSIMPAEGGPAGQFWEINGKPAENVLRTFNGQPPFSTPTPIPNYDSAKNEHLDIYSDQLAKTWELPSLFTWVDLNSTEQVFEGNKALKAHLTPWSAVHLWVDPPLDTSPYDFLEFYIYIDKIENDYYPNINVSFQSADGVDIMPIPDIMQSGYVEGGELTVREWHRIRIPLTDLGAVNQKIMTLMFTHHYSEVGIVDFYLDNISLVKYVK